VGDERANNIQVTEGALDDYLCTKADGFALLWPCESITHAPQQNHKSKYIHSKKIEVALQGVEGLKGTLKGRVTHKSNTSYQSVPQVREDDRDMRCDGVWLGARVKYPGASFSVRLLTTDCSRTKTATTCCVDSKS
jgi:hypothetical protein